MEGIGGAFSTAFLYILAAALMFGLPLKTVADNNDKIAEMSLQAETQEFVDTRAKTGVLTEADYAAFEQTVSADGNAKEIEMRIGILDENYGKKVSQASSTKYGENAMYYMYQKQITDTLAENGAIYLNQGNTFSVSLKNKYPTLGDTLNNFFYSVPPSAAYSLSAQASATVTIDGDLSN